MGRMKSGGLRSNRGGGDLPGGTDLLSKLGEKGMRSSIWTSPRGKRKLKKNRPPGGMGKRECRGGSPYLSSSEVPYPGEHFSLFVRKGGGKTDPRNSQSQWWGLAVLAVERM